MHRINPLNPDPEPLPPTLARGGVGPSSHLMMHSVPSTLTLNPEHLPLILAYGAVLLSAPP